MLFCSAQFVLFFSAVFALYWAIPWHRGRIWLLLVSSFCFYASWNHWLALLIGVTTVMDYVLARGMDAGSSPRGRRLLLGLSLVVNLGLLAYFKYANFFLRSLEEAVHAAGAEASLPVLRVLLPIGISFYTFEAISYTVDVYRRRLAAERSLANFMLFITFFPHLVAGPIVRARDFLPQVRRRKHWNWVRMHRGLQLILLGVLKKMVVADGMAAYVDPIFNAPTQYGSAATWLAVMCYALQIYCDFSGYSDLALGTAHMLGYHLAQNFNMPYLATSIADFWHRWHMSLSTWLRDYLFIPLGGSRGGWVRTARNLMLTMVLGGLWHGASWTFVVWGGLHGILLVAHRAFRGVFTGWPALAAACQSLPGTVLRWAATLSCVLAGWVLFRARTLADAVVVLQRLVIPHDGVEFRMRGTGLWLALAAVALFHVVGYYRLWERRLESLPGPVLGWTYALLFCCAFVLATDTSKAFIYFQF